MRLNLGLLGANLVVGVAVAAMALAFGLLDLPSFVIGLGVGALGIWVPIEWILLDARRS